jgi:uncharacterized protein
MASRVTAFAAGKIISHGDRDEVTRNLIQRLSEGDGEILVFEDETGRITDLDYRGTGQPSAGRPKLGVTAREVTLLPRHWEWLSGQPGGASAALRRLVEAARNEGKSARERQDAAYCFMQAACGDFAGYEEALRALYSGREDDLNVIIDQWPIDVGHYVRRLLGAGIQRTGGDT